METKTKKPQTQKAAPTKGTKVAVAETMTYEQMAALGKKEYDEAMTIQREHNLFSDEKNAHAYYEKLLSAAQHGHVDAMFELSQCHLHCIYRGLKPNEAEGLKWLRTAADHRHSRARFELGKAFDYGLYGMQQDKHLAASIYRLSTYKESYVHLGELYRRGRGVPHDSAEARRLFILADSVDDSPWNSAALNLAQMYFYGEGIEIDGKMAVNWYKKAAMRGFREALWQLGEIYLHGLVGVAEDHATAFTWFLAAAIDEMPQAMLQVAQMYEQGDGVQQDTSEAIKMYRQLVDLIQEDENAISDNDFDGAAYWALHLAEKKIELLGGTVDSKHEDETEY